MNAMDLACVDLSFLICEMNNYCLPSHHFEECLNKCVQGPQSALLGKHGNAYGESGGTGGMLKSPLAGGRGPGRETTTQHPVPHRVP